ncbi:putative short-chain dehydrogenase/reductase SDR [Lupinus albus]|uniref:Putative short-chain dehydrogenase/reductase SDR n=1 Tax=Lupinus albus TaxID=3870 RepID=A0A6A4Q0W4_LUPAL|nr:putative short-chain dehydrogenase/reductase SDR [Lupinus albus]
MDPEPYFPTSSPSLTRWWSEEAVAVVTGGNKGIGFEVVKKLAELGVKVVLTARDTKKGEAALETLRAQGHAANVHFLVLDVSDPLSISTFASSFKAIFGATLDILVSILHTIKKRVMIYKLSQIRPHPNQKHNIM